MSFDNTKHDVEINGLGYRIDHYQKSEQAPFIPRFGAGDTEESQFDLLRSRTMKGFEAGILQREWRADNQMHSLEGLFPKFGDRALYPIDNDTATSYTPSASWIVKQTAQCQLGTAIFYSFEILSGGTVGAGQIQSRDDAGTLYSHNMPTTLSNGTYRIKDMVAWGNMIWITATNTAGTAGALYNATYTAGAVLTFSELTLGDTATYFEKMTVFKGQLYGTSANPANHSFLRYTGSNTSRSFVALATVPAQTPSTYGELFVYNNRIYLTRNDGMFAWDGTALVTVDDLTSNVNDKNYRFPTVYKGYLYYWMPDGFYRFNGSMIEKLYDVGEVGFPSGMTSGNGKLWFGVNNSLASGYPRLAAQSGSDFEGTTSEDSWIFVFDGKGMFCWTRFSTRTRAGTPAFTGEGDIGSMIWAYNKLYVFFYAHPTKYLYWRIDANEFLNTDDTSRIRFRTPIFDAGYPMVYKNLDHIEVLLDGDLPSDQTLSLYYRTTGFDGSSNWVSLGDIKTQTETKRQVWKATSAFADGVDFKRIQLRLSSDAMSYQTGIAKFIVRYTLTPEFKWQWNLSVLSGGDESLAPLLLADGTEESTPARQLRGNIYWARDERTPIKFLDIDKLDLNEALDASETDVTLNSTYLLKGSDGFIQIDDEIMYWYGIASNTLTVVRGVLGTTAATHADNSKVFIVYRTVIRNIQSERIKIRDSEIPQTEDKSRDSIMNIVLQEI